MNEENSIRHATPIIDLTGDMQDLENYYISDNTRTGYIFGLINFMI